MVVYFFGLIVIRKSFFIFINCLNFLWLAEVWKTFWFNSKLRNFQDVPSIFFWRLVHFFSQHHFKKEGIHYVSSDLTYFNFCSFARSWKKSFLFENEKFKKYFSKTSLKPIQMTTFSWSTDMDDYDIWWKKYLIFMKFFARLYLSS